MRNDTCHLCHVIPVHLCHAKLPYYKPRAGSVWQSHATPSPELPLITSLSDESRFIPDAGFTPALTDASFPHWWLSFRTVVLPHWHAHFQSFCSDAGIQFWCQVYARLVCWPFSFLLLDELWRVIIIVCGGAFHTLQVNRAWTVLALILMLKTLMPDLYLLPTCAVLDMHSFYLSLRSDARLTLMPDFIWSLFFWTVVLPFTHLTHNPD